MLEVPPSKKHILKRLWILAGAFTFLYIASYIMESSSTFFSSVYPGFDNVILGIFGSLAVCNYVFVAYLTSSRKIFFLLLQERRVIFILVLLGIIFYVDNIFIGWSAAGLVYPIAIVCYISIDMIVMYFPRRVALALMALIVLVNLWNIFNYTFLIADCKQHKLAWGVFGEKVSYCTIKRLIFQTILSLMVSAAITLLADGIDNLFFCTVNIYRSTGTTDRHVPDEKYVSSMKMERDHNIATKESNVEVEMTC